jgi:1-acyl-sn-glycerol-3-phosphate acyltransferase
MPAAAAHPQHHSLVGRLRIGVRLLAMALLLCLCLTFYSLWRLKGSHNPWPRIFLGGVAWIAGVDLRVTGHRTDKGEFVVANHVSWIDVPALAWASGAAFIAHDGLAAIAPLRWLCSLNDTVFVARHDRASVARQVEQVREAIRDTGALAIFPEGTTSDGTSLLPFKSSLLSALDPVPAGIAVQPVLIDYGTDAPAIAWVGDEPGMENFLRILARGGTIALTVRLLPPLAGAALASRKTIAAASREAILAAMSDG